MPELEQLETMKDIEVLREELKGLRAEKKAILDEYTRQAANASRLLDEKAQELKNIQDIFNKDYAGRILAFEGKEKEAKEKLDRLDASERKQKKIAADFEEERLAYFNEQTVIKAEIDESVRVNRALLENINVVKEDIVTQKEKNEKVLAAISDKTLSLSEELKTLKVKNDELNKRERDLDLKDQAIVDKLPILDKKVAEIRELNIQNDVKLKAIDAKVSEQNAILKQIEQEREALEEKQAEIAALLKEQEQSKFDTLKISKDIDIAKLALKAKEIELNQKENELNERDKNIKIIETGLLKK